MPSREFNKPVNGSVIQRSLIPEGLGEVLNVATAPIAELDSSDLLRDPEHGFQRLVGQVIGMPVAPILDEKEYGKLTERLIDRTFWMKKVDRFPLLNEAKHVGPSALGRGR